MWTAPMRGELIDIDNKAWVDHVNKGMNAVQNGEGSVRMAQCAMYNRFPEELEFGASIVHCDKNGMDWDDMLKEYATMTLMQQMTVREGIVRSVDNTDVWERVKDILQPFNVKQR